MKYVITAQNLKEPICNVSAPTPERAIEKVEQARGLMLYKPQALEIREGDELIDLTEHTADIIEIGYEQINYSCEIDFEDALRIFCDRRKKAATIIKADLVEKQFNAEVKGEGNIPSPLTFNQEDDLFPTPQNKCWDCGSTIPNAHTLLCDFRETGNKILPASQEGTQYWNGQE